VCGHEGQQVPNKDGAISEQFDHRIREGGLVKTGYEYASIIQILVQAYERADRLNKFS
jgi:hypothetical protein